MTPKDGDDHRAPARHAENGSLRVAMLHATLPSSARRKEGGVTYQVHELANRLEARGHSVTVFTLDSSPSDARYTVCRLQLPLWLQNSRVGRYYGVPLLFRRQSFANFDIVHAHGDDWLIRDRAIPVLRTFYGCALQEARNSTTWLRRLNHLLLYAAEVGAAFRASRCVGISRDTGRWLPRIQRVIPCGVDLDAFRPGPQKSDVPAILFVGTLRGRKRGLLLVQQFAQFVRPALPKAELWLVGDEPLQAPGVRSFGKVPQRQLVELYQRAWAFCLPSTFEGFGVPYIEAMACGTVVTATPNPGAREVTDDGRFGLLADEGRLGAELRNLLFDDPRRTRMAQLALERVQQYSWENVRSAYEGEYCRLLGSQSRIC